LDINVLNKPVPFVGMVEIKKASIWNTEIDQAMEHKREQSDTLEWKMR
jgi:hypothetical protein